MSVCVGGDPVAGEVTHEVSLRSHPSLWAPRVQAGAPGPEGRGGEGSQGWTSHSTPLALEQSAPEGRALFPRMYTGPREVFGWSLLGSPLPVGRGWNSRGEGPVSRVLFHSGALALR